ncbi:hypothetical protein [Rufibacter aurantiacus]|uniref:hypothetical protein n=1 Tax=Rufibacter aurantiacus TaxID=2817374 RepID=UPI001B311E51|nr:hypothetical protein [Rufibacter aurantiacus]
MKLSFLIAAAALCTGTAFAQPTVVGNEPAGKPDATAMAKAEVTSAEALDIAPAVDAPAAPENSMLLQQEKPRKADKKKGKDQPQEEQQVKEVATAKRQGKPEKVSGDVDELVSRGSAARPQSAARPGRGVNAGNTVKAVGNAAKAAKSAKPVKVGGLGVGRIKVGKN